MIVSNMILNITFITLDIIIILFSCIWCLFDVCQRGHRLSTMRPACGWVSNMIAACLRRRADGGHALYLYCVQHVLAGGFISSSYAVHVLSYSGACPGACSRMS